MPMRSQSLAFQSTFATLKPVTCVPRSRTPRGHFVAPAMPVGRYIVEATLQGFAPTRLSGVTLTVGHTESVELQLSIAWISESVTVEAQTAIDTKNPVAVSRIDLSAIADLPVRGRNFTEFVQLTPAVVQESDRFGLVIGGQRSINPNVAVDGADFNDPLQGNQRGGNESSLMSSTRRGRATRASETTVSACSGRRRVRWPPQANRCSHPRPPALAARGSCNSA
jgi:hypothetical protein